jgi:hypothetical protein
VDVINDHLADSLATTRLFQQIAPQCCSGYLGDVLVLADRGYLILVEPTKADAVL